MRRNLGRAIGPALFVFGAVVVALLPRFMGEFRLLQFTLVAVYVIALLGLNVLTGYSGQISLGHGAFVGIGAYVTALRDLLKALGVSDVKMEQGSLRCDANVSLMPIGAAEFGTRTFQRV